MPIEKWYEIEFMDATGFWYSTIYYTNYEDAKKHVESYEGKWVEGGISKGWYQCEDPKLLIRIVELRST